MNLRENNHHWHRISIKMSDNYVNTRLWGYFEYNLDAGTFLGTKARYFADYYHPSGNQILIPINPSLASFNLLPYFAYSTNRYYLQSNFRYHFNGKVADYIPHINKTKLKFVVGASSLYVPEKGHYLEPFVGIEGFSIGPLPLFDIDYSFSFDSSGENDNTDWAPGLYLPIGIQYFAHKGFTFNVEAGVLSAVEEGFRAIPFGGIRIGYRFAKNAG